MDGTTNSPKLSPLEGPSEDGDWKSKLGVMARQIEAVRSSESVHDRPHPVHRLSRGATDAAAVLSNTPRSGSNDSAIDSEEWSPSCEWIMLFLNLQCRPA